jgi:DNA-binding response OmpR family regulator
MEAIRVLLIDDETMLHTIAKRVLARVSCELRCCWSGTSGLAVAREFQPDVVICDLELEDMSGVKVIETLRAQLPSVRTILTSGQDCALVPVNSDATLQKPFTADGLIQVIRSVLAQAKP